ncbi:hypothetical protein [Actinoplanes aureus]|jgi:hypothetical protein|uniref:Uncharacterized protein n=1 Tax=Actinoplanes aureus TaxID=2792083 RepID=A0A931C6D4_9ACTN|nr:hypothetical protein [Actinoplanes aureus]MBG0561472.1 hypothetical protein [Actinoplanes aureus]
MNVSVQHKSHTVVYIIFGVAFLLLAGIALLAFDNAKDSQEATAKAQQLQVELTSAGMRVPTTEQIAGVLGADGGTTCTDPDAALSRSTLYSQLTNGAAGPGQRPVIADEKVVQGQLLITKVYCPQNLEAFQQAVDDLNLSDEVAG